MTAQTSPLTASLLSLAALVTLWMPTLSLPAAHAGPAARTEAAALALPVQLNLA